MNHVLFLCTGNYYRSRFAEELFNHSARQLGLGWTADSRALAIERGKDNVGPVSIHTMEALSELGVQSLTHERLPQQCTVEALRAAGLVVALNESEHRPLLTARFPGWESRVLYWNVNDVDIDVPAIALRTIKAQVHELVSSLAVPAAG